MPAMIATCAAVLDERRNIIRPGICPDRQPEITRDGLSYQRARIRRAAIPRALANHDALLVITSSGLSYSIVREPEARISYLAILETQTHVHQVRLSRFRSHSPNASLGPASIPCVYLSTRTIRDDSGCRHAT